MHVPFVLTCNAVSLINLCSVEYTVVFFLTARCFQERDSGLVCASYELRWHFDLKTGRCLQFWYGGCGGNENRFLTETECFSECGSIGTSIIHQCLRSC